MWIDLNFISNSMWIVHGCCSSGLHVFTLLKGKNWTLESLLGQQRLELTLNWICLENSSLIFINYN